MFQCSNMSARNKKDKQIPDLHENRWKDISSGDDTGSCFGDISDNYYSDYHDLSEPDRVDRVSIHHASSDGDSSDQDVYIGRNFVSNNNSQANMIDNQSLNGSWHDNHQHVYLSDCEDLFSNSSDIGQTPHSDTG